MRYFIVFLILIILGIGLFLFLESDRVVELKTPKAEVLSSALGTDENPDPEKQGLFNTDIENQKPLADPPETIKAIYVTSWSAGSEKKINYLFNLIKETELNAAVIDIKDFSGYVAYDIKLPEVEKYKAKEMDSTGSPQVRIPRINALIKKFHDEGIYVIARITVFQDPVLATARPDLAIHSKQSGGLWLDHKKLNWIDPASKDAWDYNIVIAKDAASRGFDELNFDYIRFASDGNLSDMTFPFWNEKTPKNEVIKSFFEYLRKQLPDVKISADLFGLVTINNDDLGIGQRLEDAFPYFNYICPMVYPSHYSKGFLGYKNPALYPYEVIKYSMETALKRLKIYEQGVMSNEEKITTTTKLITQNSLLKAKLRPWLQDFDLGADYDAEMIKKEIRALYESATSTPEAINGFMLWDPSNIYTRGALQ